MVSANFSFFLAHRRQNSILFAKNYILTGGENGVCYVWGVKRVGESWEVEKIRELKQQSGPIKSFSMHPSKEWVASASDDGTCVIWDLKSLKYIGLVNLILPLSHISRSDAL